MQIIPALDLKNGRCVRLLQGRDEKTTEYSDDPVAVAQEWRRQGATRLHVVNLDGAFGRTSGNLEIIRQIAGTTDLTVQCGGGIRTLQDMQTVLEAGCAKIVLGTVAVESPDILGEGLQKFCASKIVVALDTRGGRVATHGWTKTSPENVFHVAADMHRLGVRELLHTNILHDGMLEGPDLKTIQDLASIGPDIIASGGISSADDVRAIVALGKPAVTGIIVGKALYVHLLTVEALIREFGEC